MARPSKPIDVDAVRNMVAEGIPLRRIASLLGVSHDTLTRRFASLVKPVTQKNGGRPQKQLDAKKVRQLASYGLSTQEVAALLDTSPDTITRRFAAEFKNGATKRDAKIRAQLMSRALSGKSDPQSATCLIFCAKSMLHLYDRPEADPRAAGDSFIGFLELLREQQALLANAKKPIRIEGLEVESDKDWMDRGEYSPNGVGHIESSDEFPISSAPVSAHTDMPLG